MRLERIILGVDGSAGAQGAQHVAVELAALSGAEVIAVHVMGLLESKRVGEHSPFDRHAEVTHCLEHDWTRTLVAAGTKHRCAIRDGNPVVALLLAAADFDADMIIMGSRGLGGFPELLLGSTSTQVAQHARCPVVIVPDGSVPAAALPVASEVTPQS